MGLNHACPILRPDPAPGAAAPRILSVGRTGRPVESESTTLDLSRGFLSWIVGGGHVVWLAGYHGIIQHNAGVYAVDGFIILSGFVIAQLLLTKNEPYGLYIFRRFKRLFPGLHFLSRDRLVSAAFYFRDCSERVAPRGERKPVFLVASRGPRKLGTDWCQSPGCRNRSLLSYRRDRVSASNFNSIW